MRLSVVLSDGQQRVIVSDGSWQAADEATPQWHQATLDDADWKPAVAIAPYGGGPWGKIAGLCTDVQDDPLVAYAGEPAAIRALYFAVRRVKRAILFKNPIVDFSQVLFIDQPLPQGPINPEHEAIHRMGITAVTGGRLLVLDGLSPGGEIRQLAQIAPAASGDPTCLSTRAACCSASSRAMSRVFIFMR